MRSIDDFSPEERRERGHHASRLLGDPMLEEAVAAAEQQFIQEWKDATDPKLQLAAWAKVHALPAVLRQLRVIAAQGEFASEALRPRQ